MLFRSNYKRELKEIKLKEQEGEEKLTLGSKEEKNTEQASAQKCGR